MKAFKISVMCVQRTRGSSAFLTPDAVERSLTVIH